MGPEEVQRIKKPRIAPTHRHLALPCWLAAEHQHMIAVELRSRNRSIAQLPQPPPGLESCLILARAYGRGMDRALDRNGPCPPQETDLVFQTIERIFRAVGLALVEHDHGHRRNLVLMKDPKQLGRYGGGSGLFLPGTRVGVLAAATTRGNQPSR